MGPYLKMHTMWSHSVSDPQEHIIFLLVVAHSTHEMCDLMTTEQARPQRHFAEQSPLFLDVLSGASASSTSIIAQAAVRVEEYP